MRLRLLPVLIFALAGTMTVKVGSVWDAFEISVGTETLAQGDAGNAPAAAPEGEAKPSEQPAPAEAAAPTQATGQQAATTPEAPASEQPMTEEEAAAAAAAADAAEEPAVHDPFDYTDEEVDVLQQLAKRREELDLRARQLDERQALIQAAEQRMDQKIAELKSLVKMYENMKTKAAAKLLADMDKDVLLDVVDRMN